MNLQEVVSVMWPCQFCGRVPDVPEEIETMPALWRHIERTGWKRIAIDMRQRVYFCPDHATGTAAWLDEVLPGG
jgi:hypothetical protein